MTLPNIPPVPGPDLQAWANALRDYLMKERAQSLKATPIAPQIVHKKEGESASQDGVLIYNPTDEELEMSVGGEWKRIIRNEIKYLDFDQAAGFVVGSGQMAWNEAEGTLDLGLNDGAVTLQLGQEIHYRVKNSTGATISNGSVVSAAGTDGASGHILIQKFIADGSIAPRYLLGVATEDIPDGAFGYVTHFGKLSMDTSGFTAGSVLYPSATTAGALTATPPVAPDYEMPICFALNSKSNGTIFVRVQTGYNLFELYDVKVTTPADGDFFRWDSADQRWENKVVTLTDIGGVTITSPATGQLLRYNGTAWVNVSRDEIFSFSDGTNYSEAAADGQIADATALVRNIAGANSDFAQLLFSLNSANTLLARIAAVQINSTTCELNFVTEVAGTLAERFQIDGTGMPTVSGGRFKVATSAPPASATDAGTTGEIAWDANYVYVCTATNTWKRVAIATW